MPLKLIYVEEKNLAPLLQLVTEAVMGADHHETPVALSLLGQLTHLVETPFVLDLAYSALQKKHAEENYRDELATIDKRQLAMLERVYEIASRPNGVKDEARKAALLEAAAVVSESWNTGSHMVNERDKCAMLSTMLRHLAINPKPCHHGTQPKT